MGDQRTARLLERQADPAIGGLEGLRATESLGCPPLAFDKNSTTAWKTWEPTKPGMYFELDFGRPVEIDTVAFDSPNAQAPMRFECNGVYARQNEAPLRPDLRRLATAALRREGIGYVVIDRTLFGAEDFKSNPEAWGMRFLDQASNGVRLYQLQ